MRTPFLSAIDDNSFITEEPIPWFLSSFGTSILERIIPLFVALAESFTLQQMSRRRNFQERIEKDEEIKNEYSSNTIVSSNLCERTSWTQPQHNGNGRYENGILYLNIYVKHRLKLCVVFYMRKSPLPKVVYTISSFLISVFSVGSVV